MKKSTKIFLSLTILITACLNILAWRSTEFCDFYVKNIFPIWGKTYGRLTSLFPFSVGEMMIALLLVLLAVAVILVIVAVIFCFTDKDKHGSFLKAASLYYKAFFCTLVITALVMTLNCFILYHCSTFEEKYMNSMLSSEKEYSVEELGEMRDYVVMRVNQYAKMVERDETGLICYDGNMEEEAIRSMKNLGEKYPQLSGFYVTPKKIASSNFLSQQYMQGYYFPFSMEANYNNVMYIMCKPSTMCHELAHTKGFIYEDEANLIGFLACIRSDDIVFQYSGYLSVLTYIDNDFKESIQGNKQVYNSHPKISSQVKKDKVFLTEDAWCEVEKKAMIQTSTVKKVSTAFIDTNLVLNGLEQGKANYCEVVGLLMDYYTGSEDEYMMRQDYLASQE